jgi:hypothetical protein
MHRTPGSMIAALLATQLCGAALAQEPADGPEAVPLSAEEAAALGLALQFDPSRNAAAAPAKPLRLPSLTRPGLDISSAQKTDGSATVAVKQPLPTDWNAKIGADLGLGATAPDFYQPDRPLPGTAPRGSGAAWASVGVLPDLATVDARVDPAHDQSRLGTTFKHSIPIGGTLTVTLQDSYAMTETFGAAAAAPSGLTPAPPIPAAQPVPQIWGNEKAAKFDILPTGTTFGAKFASNSADPVTHNTLSAEQKLYGPLRVTTAVTDIGQPVCNKSISAGFKLHW